MTAKARSLPDIPLLLIAGVLPLAMAPGLKDAYLLPKLAVAALLVFAAALLAALETGAARAARTGLERPIAAFAAAAVVSSLFSIDAWPSWAGQYAHYSYGVLGWALCAVVYFLAAARGEALSRRLVHALVLGSVVVAVYALLQSAGFDPYPPAAAFFLRQPEPRPISSVGAPVPLGAYLMMAVPPSVFLARQDRRSDRALGLLSLAVGLFALALTRTRGAWLGALGGVAVYAWLAGMVGKQRLAVLLVAVLACGAGLWLLQGRRAASDSGRWEIWKTAISAFRRRPVLGVGPGAFAAAFRLYQSGYAKAVVSTGHIVEIQWDAHNDWLQILSTMGLLGIAAYGWLHCRAFSILLASLDRLRGEAAALAGSLASLFLQSKTGTMSWLALFLGALVAGCLFGGVSKPASVSRSAASRGLALAGILLAAACGRLFWADLHAGRGLADRAQGRPRDAAARLELAVASNPFETGYRIDLANLLWDAASGLKDAEARRLILGRAAEAAQDGVRLRPGDAGAYRLLALAEMRRYEGAGEDRLPQADAALDAAVRLNPTLLWLREDRVHLDELKTQGRK